MRVLLPAVLALPLIGCAAGQHKDVAEACAAQGHAPGSESWRHCVEADGARIATGPGSPYANVDEEEDGGADEDD